MKRAAVALVVGCLFGSGSALAQADPPAPAAGIPMCAASAPETRDTVLGSAQATEGGLMSAHFGGGTGFFPVEGAVPQPGGSSSPDLAIVIGRRSNRTHTNAPLRLDVRVENRTAAPLQVMRALDGSLEHWRDPHWDLYLRDESTGTVYRWDFHGGRCGNVNPIRDEDVRTLPAGGSADDVPGGWANYLQSATVPVAGRYSVWVVYRYCGRTDGGLPLGPDAPTPGVRQGVFVSNALTLDVAVQPAR